MTRRGPTNGFRRGRALGLRAALGAAAVAAVASLGGCGVSSTVTRVYDGRVVEGSFVPAEAYALYLHATLAEESGDLTTAIATYEKAARVDDEDPEILTRLGDAHCRRAVAARTPSGVIPDVAAIGAADEAFRKALALDPTYAPAFAAMARCAEGRGDLVAARTHAAEAVAHDGISPRVAAAAVAVDAHAPNSQVGRARAIALTLRYAERPIAWDALLAWGRAHGDDLLVAAAFEGLVRAAPARSAEIERGAVELLGRGEAGLARRVAAAIADSPRELEIRGPRDPVVARLAVDEALLRDDGDAAERRATRGRVTLGELAARALLLERVALAERVARLVALADPGALDAHMVLGALASRGAKGEGTKDVRGLVVRSGAVAPAAAVFAFADRLAVVAGPEAAREWLARVTFVPAPPHDPIVGPLAVELAARGIVAASELDPEQRIELAARRREAPGPIDATATVDRRHHLLWLVLSDPKSTAAKESLAALSPAIARDPLVAFAAAKIALAAGARDAAALERALTLGPSNPLLLGVAIELAKLLGKDDVVPRARTRLLAVARTPAEHALATE